MKNLKLALFSGVLMFTGMVQAGASSPSLEAAQGAGVPWTAERLSSARPLPLPAARAVATTDGAVRGVSVGADAQAPSVKVKPDQRRLFIPDAADAETPATADQPGPGSQDAGNLGAYFSSSRVLPAQNAQRSTPYRPSGKLFFSDSSGNARYCSASVIRKRLVLTAGNCLYDAVRRTFYSNFMFIPAYHQGTAPYGTWNWAYAIVTATWGAGGGTSPNAADYGLLEMLDDPNNGHKIGDITGTYGYRTLALSPNHVRMLGYPGAFDQGNWMHSVDAGSFRTTSSNTVEYGSDMRDGSGGSPWLADFGQLAAGETLTPGKLVNQVVGVSSYQPVDASQKYAGASILDSRFTNGSNGILETACAHRAGNC